MILNLFKSKPKLKELIPPGSIDIHSHILPGIDDGPKNITESLNLINEIKKIGFHQIIGTPHTYSGLYENTNDTIKTSFEHLKTKIDKNITVSYASEYLLDISLIERAKRGKLLTIKDNYILVEFNFISLPINFKEMIFELKKLGYIPILAHPERYLFLFRNLSLIEEIKNMGCYLQLNLLSVTGYYGDDICAFSDKLLKNSLIDFIGSDIHNIHQVNCFNKKIKIKEVNKLEKIIDNNKFFNKS